MATEQKDVEKGLKDEEQKPPVVEESSISTNDSLKKEKNHFLRDALYFSINPTGTFYYYWTLAVSVACFYNLTTLSLVVFEDFRVYLFSYWLVGNGLADAINVADVFINSRRQFLDEGVIVSDVWSMFVIYIRHLYSWLDVLAILPTDLLLFVRPHVSLFRLNRFLKIYRMLEFVGMTEVRTIYPNLFRLYRLVFICFIIFHWNACVYFFISTFYDIDEAVHDDWEFSYEKIPDPAYFDPKNYSKMCPMLTLSCPVLDEDYVSKEFVEIGTELWFPNFVKQYSLSFYWSACTLVTLGEQPSPTHSAQMLFEICDTLLGLVIFAVIVGDVGNMVQKMNAQRSDFDEKLDGASSTCPTGKSIRFCNTGSSTGSRLCGRTAKRRLTKRCAVNMADFLPNRLHGQLAVEVHMATLSKVKLFENCDSGLLYEIILKLNLQVFSPSDYVCKKGDIGKEMYIIHHGQLEVVSEDGKKVFVTLTEGSVFGELSILNIPGNKNGNHRTASIRSVGYAHLYVLTKDDLWDVIHDYPNAKEALMEKGRQLLRNTNHLDESKAFPGPRIDESYRTVEEKFKGLNVVMDALMEQMEELEKTFYSDSMQMKQQVTDLEHTFVKKLSPIKAMRFGLVSVIMPEGITDKSQFLIPETRFES
ncbi:hypothetical protein L596_011662 [Steinernema carpocapsae]|uniref:Cyclic nucleotide-binding domain-containing protein n=1 Tax=Steinernema carpocapsae TaxID=34508 RepID=A0A4U5NUM5_STECR|nr:hypothetical protein L596_011662 [Steinernema carpocapsae]